MSEDNKQTETPEIEDDKLSIGERIQKARKNLGLSAEELAVLVGMFETQDTPESERGISLPTIYRYEKGERDPGAREIKLLCRALNVSADWLVFGEAWDLELEADAKMGRQFKSLVKMTSAPSIQRIWGSNRTRIERHQVNLAQMKIKLKKS